MNLSPSKRRKQKDMAGAIFTGRGVAPLSSAAPSSSPAFGTPVHPIKPFNITTNGKQAPILPILLPPATLRPLAFRTFTKKHSLTLTSSALQELASFIGRHCGSGWREEGLAEKVLEEVARQWKGRNGGVIVEGASPELKEILKNLEGSMSGGRIITGQRGLSRTNSLLLDAQQENGDMSNARLGLRPAAALTREESNTSFGMSALEMNQDQDEDGKDPRRWLKVINALEQPRFIYNVEKKHFEKETKKPSLMPPASHKTTAFRNRFNVIHQRLLRNEAFQTSAVAAARASSLKRAASGQQFQKITPITNLLGRHGSQHMLLGMLTVLPTGNLAISDLTGSIKLDLRQAQAIPEDSAWFTPGMIVLVDGVYEEDDDAASGSKVGLSGSSGVGGVIGGRFQGFLIGQPPCEKRRVTLGVSGPDSDTIGGGFGWIDFLGVGSERAVGSRMRRLEQRLLRRPHADDDPDRGRGRLVVLGEMNLDQPSTLQAVKKILSGYANEPEGATPLCFVFTGNFTQHAVMARGGSGGSVEYKEYFDSLAAVLAEFPMLLTSATFVFVPGDNDGWASAFSAGAATPLPRKPVPDLFTSRVRRAFASANSEAGKKEDGSGGEAVFTSNPSRLSLFGPCHEVVVFRDDISARLRRSAVRLKRPRNAEGGQATEDDDLSPEGEDVDMAGAHPAQKDGDDEQAADAMDVDSATPRKKKPSAPEVPYDILAARKLVKTVLDQGYLAPFRQSIRPVHWDYASAMQLYPLPTAMILVDTTAPAFCVTYEGCHVVNPGALLVTGRRGMARWVEYEVGRTGRVREVLF
ncbi:DNA-directed DNA polymerase epsilon, subunit B [Cytospora paraplurivora]|uniref:DNA polymerase epsilon subunit B n=1 Tax=Cytospora paraplurivora TaxID=2898453 RepID=A0AAN9U550_9PEZI